VDIRIGVTQSPRELVVELADEALPEDVRAHLARVLAGEELVLWLTDRKGKQIAVPFAKLAYVEVGAPDGSRRIGFGG